MMTLNDFARKHNLKNKATSNVRRQQILSFLSLNDIGIYLGHGPFSSDIAIVNIHPSIGTHWVCYINENYFDGYGCVCPKKLSNIIIKRNGYSLYSDYQIQKNDSFCAINCL